MINELPQHPAQRCISHTLNAPYGKLVASIATDENKLAEAMVADLAQNIFPGRTFKMHVTDPLTGKRDVKEIGV
ncbi:MAG: hypothetical protein AAFW83_13915 [Pseudomonadota bacterium]